jgi:hypothetical protein
MGKLDSWPLRGEPAGLAVEPTCCALLPRQPEIQTRTRSQSGAVTRKRAADICYLPCNPQTSGAVVSLKRPTLITWAPFAVNAISVIDAGGISISW